jgi:hypothetical protein
MAELYQYKCRSCRRLFASETRADTETCPTCNQSATRHFAFSVNFGLREHWNAAVGQYVNNSREMSDALKRQSEYATIRTGMEHNYEYVDPADMRDAKAHGVDENTLEVTRQRQHDGLIQ